MENKNIGAQLNSKRYSDIWRRTTPNWPDRHVDRVENGEGRRRNSSIAGVTGAEEREIRTVLPATGIGTAAHSRLPGGWLGNEQ
jgi:hypothetical protein